MIRLLALVPGSIGEQIRCFPALDDVKHIYPDAQIHVVVAPAAQDAYRIAKSVDQTIAFNFQGSNSLADWSNLLGVLRDREYDMALCLSQRSDIALLLWLTGIPTRIGYSGSALTQWCWTKTISAPSPTTESPESPLQPLLAALDIPSLTSAPTVQVPASDLQWAAAERQRLSLQDGGYVLLNCGLYPIAAWQTIIEDFQHRQPNLPIVLLGSSAAASETETLLQSPPYLKITRPENVGQQLAMIAGASLMLTTDWDVLQLAISAQTYTIALVATDEMAQQISQGERLVTIASATGQIADIPAQKVLDRIWN